MIYDDDQVNSNSRKRKSRRRHDKKEKSRVNEEDSENYLDMNVLILLKIDSKTK